MEKERSAEDKLVVKTFIDMYNGVMEELAKKKACANLIIHRIREENAKWNKLAETNPAFKKDGFKNLAKQYLEKDYASFKDLQSGLYYL